MRSCITIAGLALLLAPALVSAAETISYEYDARGRLTKVTRSPPPGASQPVVTSYVRDRANNRTNKTTTGSPN